LAVSRKLHIIYLSQNINIQSYIIGFTLQLLTTLSDL